MEQASSYWQSETVFLTLLQVGFLWAGYEPPPDDELLEHEKKKTTVLTRISTSTSHLRPKPLPAAVKRIFEKLMTAVIEGKLVVDGINRIAVKFDPVFLSPGYINNLSEIELNRDDLIDYARMQKIDLPKFLQASDKAAEARRQGMSEQIRLSFERTANAVFMVGKWVGESGLAPAEVTKERMQSFLMENGFKAVEQKLFDDVWKYIPPAEKSRGGRPPNK